MEPVVRNPLRDKELIVISFRNSGFVFFRLFNEHTNERNALFKVCDVMS